MRHLETPTLWVQRALKLGRFTLVKLPGKLNCGDIGAKHVDAATMYGHLDRMSIVLVGLAHETALKAKVWADGLGGYGEISQLRDLEVRRAWACVSRRSL